MSLAGHKTGKGELQAKMLRITETVGVNSEGERCAPLGKSAVADKEREHHDGQKHLHLKMISL
jgi:hypothetical protein